MSQLQFSAREARAQFSEILNKAAYGKEPVVITRQGKNIAVVISFEDYQLYRQLEDRLDGELAKERLAEGGKRYSLEEVKRELGL